MKWKSILFLLIPLLAVLLLWYSASVSVREFQYQVNYITQYTWLETNHLYFLLHAFTFIPVFLLSFDRKVHFYKSWKYLFPAIAIVGTLFIIWDVIFSHMGVWGFNERYHHEYTILYLPLEEWLFFFSVPFACVFIYECLNYYVPKDILAPYDHLISWSLIAVLFLLGLFHLDKLYTASTFILTASLLFYHYLKIPNSYRTRFYLAYLVSWVPFLIVDGVLTGGFTAAPVVLYHPEELLNWRIFSVPIEDSVYSLLLLLGVVSLMEKFRASSSPA